METRRDIQLASRSLETFHFFSFDQKIVIKKILF